MNENIDLQVQLHNPADAAHVCGCCAASVKRIANDLQLPVLRTVGGVRLFTAEQVAKIKAEYERRQTEAWKR